MAPDSLRSPLYGGVGINMKFRRKVIFTIASFAFSLPSAGNPVGEISNVVVFQKGQGPRANGCDKFDVDASFVQSFFERAVVITGRQQHDNFLFGPCYANGTLESQYGHWRWELRNLGTGTLESVTGEFLIFADPQQQSPLSED